MMGKAQDALKGRASEPTCEEIMSALEKALKEMLVA